MKKKYWMIFSIAIITLALDQFAKGIVIRHMKLGQSIPIIGNVFHLTYITNTGTAFGAFKGAGSLLAILSFAVLGALFYYVTKIKENDKWMQFAIGLLMAGTLGNLLDRLIHSYVIDFLDFKIWPVFNIADSAITVSVVILIILTWKK